MKARRGKSGRRGMVEAAGALPVRFRPPAHRWADLVGPTLGAETVMVGVDEGGTLRVMARSETACRELMARREHVLEAFNLVAEKLGARRATDLVCWVRPGLEIRLEPRQRRHRPTPPPAAATREAEREMAAVDDAELREALVAARARHIASKRSPDGT